MEAGWSLVFAAALAGTHLVAGKLRFLAGVPRSIWLSMAGGVSVAYVFVHVLPELGARQEAFEDPGAPAWLAFVEHHVYLIALLGLVVFYGLEQAALASRRRERAGTASVGVFWLHVVSFSLYNAIVGYLLVRGEGEASLESEVFYFVALALHFVVNDFGLREHHAHRYDRPGRWVLAAAVVGGWAMARPVALPAPALATLFAFLAGGIVLNVLKEELPAERESRFWAFALGGLLYAVLLLLG